MATSTEIMNVRMELADTSELPLLSDAEYNYFIDKNQGSLRRAMLDAAKSLLFKLSTRTDDTIDIMSVKSSKAAENYRLALQMFLRDPNMNPALTMAKAFAGGVSKSDMQTNLETADNNAVVSPSASVSVYSTNPFVI